MSSGSDETSPLGAGDPLIGSGDSFVMPPTGTPPTPAPNAPRTEPIVDVSRQLAAALELLGRLDQHDHPVDAGRVTVTSVGQWLSSSRCVLVWQSHPDAAYQVLGDSQTAAEEIPTALLAAGEEIAVRQVLTDSHPNLPQHRHSLLAVKQFCKATGARRILGVSLQSDAGHSGSLMLLYNRNISEQQVITTLRCLDTIRLPLSGKLAAIDRNQPGQLRRWFSAFRSRTPRLRQKVTVAALIAIGIILALPVTYHVSADCRLQPVLRRYVATPVDGPLEKVLVRPGDEVVAGQLLAKIDSREINFQLAAKEADLERLSSKFKGELARQEFSESTLTDLEVQSIQQEIELLRHQQSHLEIRSPIDGMVVSGDLERSEGIPLSKGETLMEIAPLNEMVVEISVPESDLTHVSAGMLAMFQLYALPGRRLQATVQTVHPAAQLIDHENVFVAEAIVADKEGLLRPGMRGRVWVSSHRKSVAWIAFHRAYHAVRQTMGW